MDPQLVTQALQSIVTKVVVDSSDIPALVLDQPFAPGPPNPTLETEKPRVRFYAGDQMLFAIAPYGQPTPPSYTWNDLQTYTTFGGLAIGGLAVLGLLKLLGR